MRGHSIGQYGMAGMKMDQECLRGRSCVLERR